MNWLWRMPQACPWPTPYPLPRDTSETLLAEGQCENFGLLQEKFLAFGDNRGQVQLLRELGDRKALVPDFNALKELFDGCIARWEQLAEDLGAAVFRARPEWRVVVGLRTNEVLGGGIALHPIYGFPVIPASSLKGVCHSYAQWVLERPEDELDSLFGMAEGEEALRGDLLFLDAVPVEPPVLERDIINPIFGQYYHSNSPPASYLSPNPIFFLAIGAASRYSFGVASLSGDEEAARQGVEWLREALMHIGVGGKTSAGYGYWTMEEETLPVE